MWKWTQHKNPRGEQDTRVVMMVKELAGYPYAYRAADLKAEFENRVKSIPKYNNFEAYMTWRVVPSACGKFAFFHKQTPGGDLRDLYLTLKLE
jgi:hypothetical protein